MSSVLQALSILACFSTCLLPCIAQLRYRDDPVLQWDVRGQSVREGNGVYLSPNEDLLVASSSLGYISAFGAKDGSEIFHHVYVPNTTDMAFINCYSGITFAPDYLVYSIIVNENSLTPTTHVVALSETGDELWVSPSLKGTSPGTPVVSGDGAYVFLTHNSGEGAYGRFTILDGSSGDVFYTQFNENAPFAPLGIHHNPDEGYYDGGELNRNDILVWSVQPKPADTLVGPGATFTFQFPVTFVGDTVGLSYTQLGTDMKEFQAIQKPIFADNGRSLYWGTSRSQFRCWVGEEGANRYRFNRPRAATLGFSRGSPPMQAVFAPLALSHNDTNRYLFGGTASFEFVRLNQDFSDEILVATVSHVKAQAHVSPDDAFVYYMEVDGHLHQADTGDLFDNWVLDIGEPVLGDFAMNNDGTVLFVGDVKGLIQAFRIGDVSTGAPSTAPSAQPAQASSPNPTAVASNGSSGNPSEAPTPMPSLRSQSTVAPDLIGQPSPDSSDQAKPRTTVQETNDSSATVNKSIVTWFLIAAGVLMA